MIIVAVLRRVGQRHPRGPQEPRGHDDRARSRGVRHAVHGRQYGARRPQHLNRRNTSPSLWPSGCWRKRTVPPTLVHERSATRPATTCAGRSAKHRTTTPATTRTLRPPWPPCRVPKWPRSWRTPSPSLQRAAGGGRDPVPVGDRFAGGVAGRVAADERDVVMAARRVVWQIRREARLGHPETTGQNASRTWRQPECRVVQAVPTSCTGETRAP